LIVLNFAVNHVQLLLQYLWTIITTIQKAVRYPCGVFSMYTSILVCRLSNLLLNEHDDVVEVLEIIQYSALVVRSGYTGNVVVLRVACTKW